MENTFDTHAIEETVPAETTAPAETLAEKKKEYLTMEDLEGLWSIDKKNTNPGSDKIMVICRSLDITPEQLLTGEGIDDVTKLEPITERTYADRIDAKLLEDFHGMQDSQKKRLLAYVDTLKKLESLEELN